MPSTERYRDEQRGVWRWRGRYYDAAGRRRSRTFDTKAAAARWAGKQEDKAKRGRRTDDRAAKLTWGEWCDRWFAAKAGEPTTRRTDTSIIRAHVRPRWGSTPVYLIERIDVQAWVNQIARDRSASTTRKAFYALSGSMRTLVAEGVLDANPCTGVVLPTNPVGQERFLTDVEAGQILYHLDGRWRVLAEFALGTGLRMAEVAGLHVARVDLEAGRVYVIETYDAVEGEMKGYPKSKRRREVPLSPELAALLQSHLDLDPPPPRSCGKPHRAGRCPGGLLFRGELGAPIDSHNFGSRQWKTAAELAGFYVERRDPKRRKLADGSPKTVRDLTVHPHDLRHTYASRLVQQGIPLERVQLLLGHEDIKTTQRYAHLIPDDGWDEVRAALSTSVTAARAEAAESARRAAANGPMGGPDPMSNLTVPDRPARRLRAVRQRSDQPKQATG